MEALEARSISAWKTIKVAENPDGRLWVKIINGTDGNEDILNRIVEVIRLELGGQKIIFKAPVPQVDAMWNSRSGNSRLEFHLIGDIVRATLHEKNSSGWNKKYDLQEHNITIERYNLSELLRGLKQETYRMDQLLPHQKEAILRSIQPRNIEIINDTPLSGRINILALP